MDRERSGTVQLAATPVAAGLARHFTSCTLRAWQLLDLVEPAELLVSELFTNSVKALGAWVPEAGNSALTAPQLVSVQLSASLGCLVIKVGDDDTNAPVLRMPEDDAECGRGLMLVDLLSSRWGYFYPPTGGKVVWCQLEVG